MENLTEIRPGRFLNIIHHQNESPKTLFLIHGAGGRADQWRHQIEFFKNDYNIVAADMLGQGKSARPATPNRLATYSFEALSADIAAIFMRFKTEENAVLGHSYGGAFAAHLALQNPDTIQKLVLTAPTNLQPKVMVANLFYLPIPFLNFIQPWLARFHAKLIFSPFTDKKLVASEVALAQNNAMEVMKPLILGMFNIPQTDISKIKQPTLVITSASDKLLPQKDILKFYRKIPNVEFKEIEKAGHMLILEQAAEVNQIIKDFLDS